MTSLASPANSQQSTSLAQADLSHAYTEKARRSRYGTSCLQCRSTVSGRSIILSPERMIAERAQRQNWLLDQRHAEVKELFHAGASAQEVKELTSSWRREKNGDWREHMTYDVFKQSEECGRSHYHADGVWINYHTDVPRNERTDRKCPHKAMRAEVELRERVLEWSATVSAAMMPGDCKECSSDSDWTIVDLERPDKETKGESESESEHEISSGSDEKTDSQVDSQSNDTSDCGNDESEGSDDGDSSSQGGDTPSDSTSYESDDDDRQLIPGEDASGRDASNLEATERSMLRQASEMHRLDDGRLTTKLTLQQFQAYLAELGTRYSSMPFSNLPCNMCTGDTDWMQDCQNWINDSNGARTWMEHTITVVDGRDFHIVSKQECSEFHSRMVSIVHLNVRISMARLNNRALDGEFGNAAPIGAPALESGTGDNIDDHADGTSEDGSETGDDAGSSSDYDPNNQMDDTNSSQGGGQPDRDSDVESTSDDSADLYVSDGNDSNADHDNVAIDPEAWRSTVRPRVGREDVFWDTTRWESESDDDVYASSIDFGSDSDDDEEEDYATDQSPEETQIADDGVDSNTVDVELQTNDHLSQFLDSGLIFRHFDPTPQEAADFGDWVSEMYPDGHIPPEVQLMGRRTVAIQQLDPDLLGPPPAYGVPNSLGDERLDPIATHERTIAGVLLRTQWSDEMEARGETRFISDYLQPAWDTIDHIVAENDRWHELPPYTPPGIVVYELPPAYEA